MKRLLPPALLAFCFVQHINAADATDTDWIDLSKDFSAFQKPTGSWLTAASVRISPDNERRLAAEPGKGIIVNGKTGRTNNLITKQQWGDLEVYAEFMIPKHSNSGIKLHGVYEIQIYDSWGATKLTGADCGGIYPRGESKPTYHHLDDGIPPLLNACKKPGEWQTLDIWFRAPKLNEKGDKIANGQFEKVLLNGKLVHDHAELKHPTGNAWNDKEHATGPLLIQADHGPVAFRNLRVRPLNGKG